MSAETSSFKFFHFSSKHSIPDRKMLSSSAVLIAGLFFFNAAVFGVPYSPDNREVPAKQSVKDLPPLVIPVVDKDDMNAKLLPIGTTPKDSNRTARFFGLTTGSSGNNLQLGLSFIVPFLNIPIGGGSSILYEGNNNFGTSTSAFGTSTSSLLGINSGTIIIAIVVGMAAVFLIPLFIYSFTGINTSPYGRSDHIQDILTNLASRVDDALQQYNIDAPSCLQRAVCTQVKSSTKRTADGTSGSWEKIIDGLATSPYLSEMLGGTKILEAAAMGRQSGTPCSSYFVKCPYNIDAISRALTLYAAQYGEQLENNNLSNNVLNF